MRKQGGLNKRSKRRLRKKLAKRERRVNQLNADFRENSANEFSKTPRAQKERERRRYRNNSKLEARASRASQIFKGAAQKKEATMDFWNRAIS